MKKLFLMLLLAGSAGLVHAHSTDSNSSSYSQDQSGQSGYGSNKYSSDSSSKSKEMSDQKLTSAIMNALSSDKNQTKFQNVTASVSNGVVTLQGTVNSQGDKDDLGALIGGLSGVKNVNNQVTVQSNSNQGAQSYSGNIPSSSNYGSNSDSFGTKSSNYGSTGSSSDSDNYGSTGSSSGSSSMQH